ncbi:MAG: hypothetical protein K0S70_190 [Microbacterium sp.]|jgi:hypothetical protein|nr:hypothetical protein [Microbacterium sp.]
MTDDLLDEATRLASTAPPGSAAEHILKTPRVLRALVERVQQAERRANFEAMRAVSESIERDAARGKLDKVRRGILDEIAKFEHGDSEEGWPVHNLRNVLAILDGKTGD